MGDLDIGWAVPTEFPATGWPRESIDQHLAQARAEIPAWDDPEQTRLGFAMAAPHPEAVRVLGDWSAVNTTNVGVHTRFGEGKAGTRRLEKEALAVLGCLYHGGALDGHLTSGASEATLAALRIARNLLRTDGHRIRVLTSDLCHSSVAKAAEILDLDLVRLPAGPAWTLAREQVRQAAAEAIGAGVTGIIVVATAGYYNSGFADPVDEIAADLRDLAFRRPGHVRCFLHVDAAHGGFVFPFTAPDLPFDFRSPGVHSMAVDPHKAGLMPYSCGALLVRKGLIEHVTRIDPHTRIPDETVLGSRPGATAAALWATLHTLGRSGYTALTTRCLELRDQLTAAVRAADPDAVLVPAPHAPVVSAAFSHPGGRLPPQLCERYRLVPLALPDPHGDGATRLFYHFYASGSLAEAQITAFAGHLADATAQARATAADGGGSGRSITSEVVADTRTHTDCFRHFVVHPEGRRDPHVPGYSFHTFAHRRTTGEQLQDTRWGEARAGGDLWVYAPDLKNPFANELMGVRTDRYFLEVLDLHQQQLSLVGAIHATMLMPGSLRVLLNFEADGAFRSAEYKFLGEHGADELQIFPDAITAKIGKDAAGFLRPHSDDYSFSIDTSAEISVHRTDGAAAPVVLSARHNADVLLPRRRHLRREQFRRFPNRFFDTELDIAAGRTWTGTAYLAELLAPTVIGTVLAAHSATAGLCTVDGRISDSSLHLALNPLSEPRTEAVQLSAPFALGQQLHDALPRLDVRDPSRLGIEQVVDFAEQVHEVFTRDGLPSGLVIAGVGR
ncbi:pyridoxal phosphate-dependent decarboxylase family protein [Streptomyces europaeiscabiei]|uniref:pyridoxal phosphate-dependent decarboxylase family protein n=1 Tax=Streptomyces europaeiscabiei TaxID=146819 RepID=UPI0029A4236B|nr:pyridoxal-dependent decarboxylase [Streptomyces europaeiscabiei]MDX2757331.1 pyridoxal-dependent decarboxylase [Streptomyces europaeiscabiei]